MKNRRNLFLGLIVSICIVLVLVSLFIFKDKIKNNENTSTSSSSSSSNTVSPLYKFDLNNQPVLGDKNAPVTIVEFGDYKCPDCGMFANNVFPKLENDYIKTGKVKIAFKNFPFVYEDSVRTDVFQKGVYKILGNDAFWEMHKKIYNHQKDFYTSTDGSNEHKDIYTEEYLLDTAKTLFGEQKSNQLKGVLQNKEFVNEMKNDLNEAKKFNIFSVPTVFVDGKKVENPFDYQALQGAINEGLKNDGHK